jgi:hypothetical protein
VSLDPHDVRYRKRWHTGNPSNNLVSHVLTVPEDVERRESHEPCFMCGVRRGCRHRPWMLAEEAA